MKGGFVNTLKIIIAIDWGSGHLIFVLEQL